jgi:hypothetical protein
MKLENVQRVNRMKEYKRMNTLKKIEGDELEMEMKGLVLTCGILHSCQSLVYAIIRAVLRSYCNLSFVHISHLTLTFNYRITKSRASDTNARTGNMIDTRKALVEDRKKAAAETRKQKEAIAKVRSCVCGVYL